MSEETSPAALNAAALEKAHYNGHVRKQIVDHGYCELPEFVSQDVVKELVAEAWRLKPEGFRSYEKHNIYLDESEDTDITKQQFRSSKTLVNQKVVDDAQGADRTSTLLGIYRSPALRKLVAAGMGLDEVHLSADPYGGVYYNFFEAGADNGAQRGGGDQLGWHFDRSEFSVNLILQEAYDDTVDGGVRDTGSTETTTRREDVPDVDPCDAKLCPLSMEGPLLRGWGSGRFVFWPDSRPTVDKWVAEGRGWPRYRRNSDEQAGLADPEDRIRLVAPQLKPGTLYLFAGGRSLHCVTEMQKSSAKNARINAIFTFFSEPGQVLNAYTRKKFFGADTL